MLSCPRLRLSLLALLVGGAIFAQPGATTGGQQGGIFRISLAPQSGLDYIDPALSVTAPAWARLQSQEPPRADAEHPTAYS